MLSSNDFVKSFNKALNVGDRKVLIQNAHSLGGTDVVVNYINLPKGDYCRAEQENNRMLFIISGFDKKDPDVAVTKVKVEMRVSALPREYKLRGKTAAPTKAAQYLADFLNKVAAEVAPHFTHTKV